MPNFDSLRSSIITPLAYICRPKEKPVALYGLWTLGDGVTTDLSRYGGTCSINIASTNTTEYGFPLSTFSYTGYTGSASVTMNMGTTLDMSKDWSWEGYFKDPANRPYSYLSFSNVFIRAGGHDDSGGKALIAVSGAGTTEGGSWRNPGGIIHRAVQYTASDTTIRVYKNGAIQTSRVCDLSGVQQSMLTYTFYSGASGDTVWGVGNIRICQKALGTSTTFPTPTGLYTGYETL